MFDGIHHRFLWENAPQSVCQAQQSTGVNSLSQFSFSVWTCMRWNRWKWQAAISASTSLQTAPNTSEPAFFFFTFQQRQHSSGRCGWELSAAFMKTTTLSCWPLFYFRQITLKDNQIKRLCWLPPPAKANRCRWTWESYRDKQWHSLIDRVLKINSSLWQVENKD